ncbi:mucin-5AC-like [Eleutherodactylus coqui]|uniref:mucin-5AC-like n=1 Tax=Eleutherodactylus coqui TaxID=57060 RepID=UPI003462DE58
MKPTPAPIPQFTSHSGQVCSTWGNYHFRTLNGDIYHYPGTCNYLFASHCKSNNEDFNIQIQRTVEDGKPVISHMTAVLLGVVVEIRNKTITLDGVMVEEMPAEKARVRVDKLGKNIKITASNNIFMLMNEQDNLLLKLNRNKYANQTCGLCGDFSGVRGFTLDGQEITPIQYGNLQIRKIPTEECADVPPSSPNQCKDKAEICKSILTGEAFSNCNEILKPMDYIDSCVQDLCRCSAENSMYCQCSMFAEYSRQCTHAGGVPRNWRTPEMCPQSCDHNMVYQEYGSPCPNTCSNTERTMVCEDHSMDGCFCPPGTVLDDINNTGCIPQKECCCMYNSEIYNPGSSFSTPCRECTCASGKWKCQESPCTGTCSVEGGSHITSFDGSHYTINGDCTYVLVKHNAFTVLAELRRCAIANKKSCMKSLTLAMKNGENVLVIKDSGMMLLNWIPTQLPVSVGNITMFRPTSFSINMHTNFDLSMIVLHVPTLQVHIHLGPTYHNQIVGLCGNFNSIQSDDFMTISGVSEGTAASFANAYKSNSNCPNIKNNYEDPCSLNIEAEKYAQHWCGLLTSPTGPFSSCRDEVDPLPYYTNCLWDTCSCQDSEECMCAALASYAYACAKKGVTVIGWRDNVCDKYTKSCKDSQVYQYDVTQCQPTCRSRSHDDTAFNFNFSPVDGCVCIEGTYMNDNGDCIAPSLCPCYYQGNAMQSGEMVEENGMKCTCDRGELTCMGAVIKQTVCSEPLVYLNCSSAPKGTKGVECQKSCNTLDMDCFSYQCVSGCVCPPGWVSDEKGSCIREPQCPCIHNEATYQPGESISVGCNTCTCKNRRWDCTHNACLGTCSVYGDGHYITFDSKQYTFSGNCEYVLVQDNCGGNEEKSYFKVITENVPCGTTGSTCSQTIKFHIEGHEFRLTNERIEVVKRNGKEKIPCTAMQRGMYFIFKCDNGVMLMWDKKTTIHTKLDSHFKGKVCGLCGNYDDKESNDFTTRTQSVVESLIEFGNSWKTDPTCPDVRVINDPCSMNPYRKNWALRQCSIIISDVFARCHAQVEPGRYYESCISDSCACDTGGDCECFCTTVALYAQACGQHGICINWRTPFICPMFCDYYNDVGDCEWHYKPCGDKCIKTCRNPKGECLHEVSGCEGCYPKCPPSRPFFNEDAMKCVDKCGCEDEEGSHYNYGEIVKSPTNCYKCVCTMNEGIDCEYDINACVCEHGGKQYEYNTTIPNDNLNCTVMKCGENGQIVTIKDICTTTKKPATNKVEAESSTTNIPITTTTQSTKSDSITLITDNQSSFPTTKTLSPSSTGTAPPTSRTSTSKVTPSKSQSTFPSYSTAVTETTTGTPTSTSEATQTELSTSSLTSSSPTATTTTYTPCQEYDCNWSQWIDTNHPTSNMTGGDDESFERLKSKGIMVCPQGKVIRGIECRATSYQSVPLKDLPQNVTCDQKTGLLCRNKHNPGNSFMCFNFELRCHCCKYYCPTTAPITTKTQSTESHSTTSITDNGTSSPTTETLSPSSTGTAPPTSRTSTSKVTPSKSQSTFPSYSTAVTETTTGTPTSTSEATQTELSTSSLTSSSPTATTTTYTPCQEYDCNWSQWIDTNHPTSNMTGGDDESFERLKSKGIMVCPQGKVIRGIECRATSYQSVPLKDLPQNVTCDQKTGLLCRNKHNPGNSFMCFNFELRCHCCKYYCPTTAPITTKTQSMESHSTTSITDNGTSSPTTETLSPSSTGTAPPTSRTSTSKVTPSKSQSTFPSYSTAVTETTTGTPTSTSEATQTELSTSSLTSSSPTATTTTYTPCQEYDCNWSQWIDTNHPTSNMTGGDDESFERLKSKGIMVCPQGKVIRGIECRATSYQSVPLKDLPQNVTCDQKTGLLCRNKHNPGNSFMCFNFELRCHCCKYYCPTTAPITTKTQSMESHSTTSITDNGTSSPTTETLSPSSTGTAPPTSRTSTSKVTPSKSQSTFPSYSTAVTETTTGTPTSTSEATQTELSTSSLTSSSPTATTTTYTPCQEYDCNWSQWIDTNHPTSNMTGGDDESFERLKSKGIMVCPQGKVIRGIECRATSYQSVPLKDLPQNVTCDQKTGLLCRNKHNPGNSFMCFNFELRCHCCKYYCPTTAPITTKTQSMESHSTTSITDNGTSSPTTETLSPSSTGTAPPTSRTSTSKVTPSKSQSTFPSYSTAVTETTTGTPTSTSEATQTELSTSSLTSSSPTATATTYTPCQEYDCNWSQWIDTNHPTSNMTGGDDESFERLKSKGIMVCPQGKVIRGIECRATSYQSVPLKDLPQNVTCDQKTGLLCRNKHNPGNSFMCFNFELRCHCCKYYCPTTAPITTKTQSTESHSTTSITDNGTSSPTTETLSPSSTGTAPPTSRTSTSKVTPSKSQSTFPSYSTAVTETTTGTPTSTSEATQTELSTSSLTSSSPTATTTTYTPCQEYDCNWSQWIDTNHPTSNMTGGDDESFERLKSKGIMVCPQGKVIRGIECRATSYQSVPLKDLPQNVTCDQKTGLLCRNKHNPGNSFMCFNFELRCHCCKYYCPTTAPITTKTQSMESHSTTSITDNGTSSPTTETLSPSSTGTAPPTSRTSTSKVTPSKSQSTFPSYSTAVTETTTGTPTSTSEATQTELSTSSLTSSSPTATTTTYTPCQEYDCNWSQWIDTNHPTSNMTGGDDESFERLKSKGIMVCPQGKVIRGIECRATSYQSVPLKDLPQNVTCDQKTGLLCRNKHNPGNSFMCFNFELRCHCCKYYCPTTAPITTKTQSMESHSTTSITDNGTSSPTTETLSPSSTGTAPPTSRTSTSKVTPSKSQSTFPSYSTAVTETTTGTPTSTSEATQTELSTSSLTSSSPTATTTTYTPCQEYDCNWSQWIDTNHPTSNMTGGDDESFERLKSKGIMVCPQGKVIRGIECRATSYQSVPLKDLPQNVTCDQKTGLLCRNKHNPGNSFMCFNFELRCHCCKYYCPTTAPITTKTQSTESHSTTSITDNGTSSPTTETLSPSSTGTAPPTSRTSTSKVTPSKSQSTFPSYSTAVTETTTGTPTSTSEATQTELSTSSLTSSSPTATTTTYTPCQEYDCNWSQWIDTNHPTSNMTGGDDESFERLKSKGIMVCPQGKVIRGIECRATSYQSVPLKDLPQNVTCDQKTGLLCRNKHNPGNSFMCFNFELRCHCCKYYCPTTAPITTKTQSTESHSTTSITDNGTSSPTTETLSPSSTGTAPPTSRTSTSKVTPSKSQSTFPSYSTAVTETTTGTPTSTSEATQTELSTSSLTSSSPTATTTTYTPCQEYDCNWSQWIDTNHPTSNMTGGDDESFERLKSKGIMVCPQGKVIRGIECRATSYQSVPLKDLPQNVTCDQKTGLLCRNKHNPGNSFMCFNFELRCHCCKYYCPTTAPITTKTQSTESHSTTSITDNGTSSPTTETLSPSSTGTAPPTSRTSTSKVTPSKSQSTFPSYSTAVTETTTGTPTSTSEATQTELSTSSLTSSSPTATTTTYTPCQEYDCNWSQWIDTNHPTSNMTGGDDESFERLKSKGIMVCPQGKVIRGIECRATSYQSVPLKDLPQNVTCDQKTGLLCRNKHNPGNSFMCFNFELRCHCCKYYCPTTAPITTKTQSTESHSTTSITDNGTSSPTTETLSPSSTGTAPPTSRTSTSKVTPSKSQSTFPSYSTAVTETTTGTPTSTSEATQTELSTSSLTSSSPTATTTTYTPCQEYDCNWSQWIDTNHPTSNMTGGDDESFERLKSKGIMVCPQGKVIRGIECRATSYQSVPLKDLPQNVTCDQKTGLLCRNKHNPGNSFMCFNFELRCHCCKYYCPTTAPITTKTQSTESHSTTSITDNGTSSPTTETLSPSSTGTAPPTSRTSTSKVTPSKSQSTFPSYSTAVTETTTGTPTSTSEATQTELSTSSLTSSSPTATTTTYTPCQEYDCNWSQWIDTNHPTSNMTGGDDESFERLKSKGIMVCPQGKVIRGIECRATSYQSVPLKDLPQNVTCDQKTGLLCRNKHNPGNSFMCFNFELRCHCCKYYCPTTAPITTKTQSMESHSTTSITDNGTSSPTTETLSPSSTGTAPPTSRTSTSKVTPSKSQSTFPSYSTAVTETTTGTPTSTSEATQTELSTSSLTSSSPTATTTTYTPCQEYDCNWSQWIDTNHPTSNMTGGDDESFERLKSKGIMVCPQGKVIRGIECRATSYQSVPLKDLPQNVTCDQKTGLLCRNKHNPGNSFMCFNFELRCHCCKYYCPTTAPITTKTQSTESHSTTSITDNGTSSPTTETLSPSSTGTAPPTSRTSTSKVTPSKSQSTFPSYSTAVTETTTGTPTSTSEATQTELSTSSLTSSSPTATTTTYTPCQEYDCNWSQWIDTNHPTSNMTGGDDESFERLKSKGIMVCPQGKVIRGIECRATSYQSVPLKDLPQNVTCDQKTGLLCRNKHNPGNSFMCFNFELRCHCCKYYCPTTAPITTKTQSMESHSTTSITDNGTSSPTTETLSPSSTGTAPPTSRTSTSKVTPSKSQSTFPSYSTAVTETTTGTPTSTSEATQTELSTSSLTSSSPTATTTTYTPCQEYDCNWSQWIDTNHPTSNMTGGDDESFERLKSKGIMVCPQGKVIRGIECRATSYQSVPLKDLPQNVTCDQKTGLLCRNKHNPGNSFMCFNFELRCHCCKYYCPTTAAITTKTQSMESHSTTLIPSHSMSPITLSISTSGTRPVFISTVTSSITPPESQTAANPFIVGGSTSSHQPVTTTKTSTVTERPDFCVYDGSIYKEGSLVSKDTQSCQECRCIMLEDTPIVSCTRIECDINCPLGYLYEEVPGQCCGRCVKNVCFFDTTELVKDESDEGLPEQCCENCDQDVCSHNNTLLIKPGKLWRLPSDNCTSYECDTRTLQTVKRVMSCPVIKPLECSQGILVNFTSADGCCTIQYCEPRKCDVMKSWKVIESDGCEANVTLTICGGYCSSISRHPSFPKMVEHDCTCCQPTQTAKKKVHLLCKDGQKTSYSYIDVLQCACRGAECVFTE